MTLVEAFRGLGAYSDPLAWLVVTLFVAVAGLEAYRREWARPVGAAAWGVFGVFWLTLAPYYIFGMKSAIEGLLSLAALPLCWYVGYLLYRGRDSLFVATRAVAFMGLVFMPFETIPVLRRTLIEAVTDQTHAVIQVFGYHPTQEAGPIYGYESQLAFVSTRNGQPHRYVTYIEIACTGIGSMAIFGGLVAAVRAPLRRKLAVLGVVIPVIYVLNIVRNTFIAVAFGDQWFQVFVPQVMAAVGYADPGMVSFFIADRVLSQLLSVVALVALALYATSRLPGLYVVVEDALFVLTGREYDLEDRLGGGPGGGAGGPTPVPDGGD